jgi:MOSC domain-containing protein YiiM
MSISAREFSGISTPPEQPLGIVEGIFITPAASAPMRSVENARAVEGLGLEGDRYHQVIGTFSKTPGGGRHLTMIDAAALEALETEHGIALEPGASRRNLVTRGVSLLDLIGERFWVGDVLCEGIRECPPCGHLESLTTEGVLLGLTDRGGLRVEIRQSGTIKIGDSIRLATNT